jgi:hypothetical protein
MKRVITPEKESYILENYLKQSKKSIATTLGIDKGVLARFLKAKNLNVPIDIVKRFKSQALSKPYTAVEHAHIIAHIKTKSIKQIAFEMGRSATTLQKEVHKMGLTHIIEVKKTQSYFKKGSLPQNKGLKQVDYMTQEAIERTKATRFKKGQSPHNILPIGAEVQRKDKSGRVYTMVKSDTEKKLLFRQRQIWQAYHGKIIPPKHKIVFLDGNTQNFSIENLECISNAEAMKRNSVQNLPKELIELVFIKSAITRQINKHNNHEN